MNVLTQAALLISKEEVADQEQKILLNEMVRFLSHQSAGVKSFDSMPSCWKAIVASVQAGGVIPINSFEADEIVSAWHQEIRDLSLMFSRQLGENVRLRISRVHNSDPAERVKHDRTILSKEKCLKAVFDVPNAAAPIEFCADLQTRSAAISMRLKAPSDRKSTSARLNWLLRQMKTSDAKSIFVRLHWPGRAPMSQFTLSELRADVRVADGDRKDAVPVGLEVALVRDLAGRFGQTRNFISEIESMVPEFYEQIGQYLKAWHAPAPKLQEERSEPSDVDREAVHARSEEAALHRGV